MPSQFDSPYTHWSKRFLLWLQEIEFTTEYGRKLLDLHIEQLVHLRKMLLQETRAIRNLSRKSSLAEPLRLITSIPGIGITTGILFLIEIDNIARFKNSDHLASYVGLIPMCHSSGEKQCDGEITLRKHSALRCCIIESAWTAIGRDPAMTMAYEDYRKRMNAQKAIVKIARKLINRVFFVLKHKREYAPCVVR